MKKQVCAAALAGLCTVALALAVQAQDDQRNVTMSKDRADTVKLNVSGGIELDYIWRSPELTHFIGMYRGAPVPTGNSDCEDTFEGEINIRLDVELSTQVSAVVQIGKDRTFGDSFVAGVPLGMRDRFAGGFAEWINLQEAHVNFKELILPELSLQVGIPTWSFDVRGKGSAFAFGPRRSQAFTRNHSGLLFEDGSNGLGNDFTNRFGAIAFGGPGELDPMGAVAKYTKDEVTVEVVALPTVIEGGSAASDEALYAANLWYDLSEVTGEGSRFGVIGAVSSFGMQPAPGFTVDGPEKTEVFTIGGGLVLNNTLAPGLELFGEIYKQFGDAGEFIYLGQTEEAEADGLAFQVGGEYHFDDEVNKPWLGLSYTMVSGDDSSPISDPDDNEIGRFMSYENVSDLMIVEDMYYGLDIDTNYKAIKISGGLTVPVAGQDLEIAAIVGICNTTEDVRMPKTGDPTNTEDEIGNEIDVKLKWNVGKQASISLAFGYLMGSEIIDLQMENDGNGDNEDTAAMAVAGVNLQF